MTTTLNYFQTRDKDGNVKYNPHSKQKTDGLVVHIHGGGFVAQSSKSHEVSLYTSHYIQYLSNTTLVG